MVRSFSRVGLVSRCLSPSHRLIVGGPAEMLVRFHLGQRQALLRGQRHAIQAVLEDRIDVPVGSDPGGQGPRVRADALGPAQDPGRRPLEMLLVRFGQVLGDGRVPAPPSR